VPDLPDKLGRISRTIELAQDLALVLVVGPDLRAPEGLGLVSEALPADRDVLWHRLHRDGPDLAAAVGAAETERPVLLVHGLERLGGPEREVVLARLNLLRDTLGQRPAAVVLWVPSSGVEDFRRHCPDLFAWRSLWVTFDEHEVPASARDEAVRTWLTAAVPRWERVWMPGGEAPLERVYVEPMVRASAPDWGEVRFDEWVEVTDRGVLTAGPGAGKTVALRWLALDQARRVDEGDEAARIPVLVSAMDLSQGEPSSALPAEFERWAASGLAWLLVDGLDEPYASEALQVSAWVERMAEEHPSLKILVAGRPDAPLPETWSRAELQAWSRGQIDSYRAKSGGYHVDPDRWGALASTPLFLAMLVERGPVADGPSEARASLLDRVADLAVEGWDVLRDVGRKGKLLSRRQAGRVLEEVALEAAAQDVDTFSEEAVSHGLRRAGVRGLRSWVGAARGAGRELVDTWLSRTGLVVRDGAALRFAHPPLQAALAARALAGRVSSAEFIGGAGHHRGEGRWREVLVLALAIHLRGAGGVAPEHLAQWVDEARGDPEAAALLTDAALAAGIGGDSAGTSGQT